MNDTIMVQMLISDEMAKRLHEFKKTNTDFQHELERGIPLIRPDCDDQSFDFGSRGNIFPHPSTWIGLVHDCDVDFDPYSPNHVARITFLETSPAKSFLEMIESNHKVYVTPYIISTTSFSSVSNEHTEITRIPVFKLLIDR